MDVEYRTPNGTRRSTKMAMHLKPHGIFNGGVNSRKNVSFLTPGRNGKLCKTSTNEQNQT